jgi:hypothetical protein
MCRLGQRADGWIITEPAGWMRADGDNLMWPWCLHTTNPDHLMPSRPSLTDASTNNIVKLIGEERVQLAVEKPNALPKATNLVV